VPKGGRASATNQVTVCYDGECALCLESVARVKSVYRGHKIRWIPYQHLRDTHPELAEAIGPRELSSALHVIEADGTSVRSGAEAVLRIADIVPRLRIFARLGRLPFVNWLVEPMYGFVARHRHRLSRLLGSAG
jgi:predicted DCC family thiol-disulfide oxidoreductase YuxK